MSSSKTTKKEELIPQSGNVDQIREILFGSQGREFNERCSLLKKEIDLVHEQADSSVKQCKKELEDRVTTEVDIITKKIKHLTTHQQKEVTDVRNDSVELEKRLQDSFRLLEDELTSKIDIIQKQLTKERDMLREHIDTLHNNIMKQIDTKAFTLESQKLSYSDMANIFLETAMKLKEQEPESDVTPQPDTPQE